MLTAQQTKERALSVIKKNQRRTVDALAVLHPQVIRNTQFRTMLGAIDRGILKAFSKLKLVPRSKPEKK